ncbi:hypothetical protein [Rhabdochromatium marinum]|uniref:hypothetical protein n=1 Tax=Rhabdochromatium marinum TaxID=48729 RepID=UPI0019046F80|nr:hypothetical protein [Rhabdochromatium marinum]
MSNVPESPVSARSQSRIDADSCEISTLWSEPHAFSLEDIQPRPSADHLRQRVADLMLRYVRTPSRVLAEQVGACCASLAWHPEVCSDPECHCTYRGLVRHWFWLAGHGGHQPG